MSSFILIIQLLLGFGVIVIASFHVGKLFPKLKLPLITGFVFVGILTGPSVLAMFNTTQVESGVFINDFSLAFIAFAAGAELFLGEMRSRMKSILWMTFGQFIVSFVMSTIIVFYLIEFIPGLKQLDDVNRLAVALLVATIFVANSPSSAIAVINEMRAKGPITQVALGVTVIKDVLVIILFTICFGLVISLTTGEGFNLFVMLVLIVELISALVLGYILGRILEGILYFKWGHWVKLSCILILGLGSFLFSHYLRDFFDARYSLDFHVEPLLICILASFYVANYTAFRPEFQKILDESGPYIYAIFFTYTGATLSLEILIKVWMWALIFFFVRLVTLIFGSIIGGKLGNEPLKVQLLGWMPFVTQAGVGLGLTAVVANEFTVWGEQFATIVIAVIVFNQIIGPPMFKWVLNYFNETHVRSRAESEDHYALIFGLESQSLALAKLLIAHKWKVRIATFFEDLSIGDLTWVEVVHIDEYSLEMFKSLEADKAHAIVCHNSDDENYLICEFAYEHYGTKELIVRLKNSDNAQKFRDLGAIVVNPRTAIVNLMDHFVRSPLGTSLILGLDDDKDTVDVEVNNPEIHGITIRQLRIPSDILILSIQRNGKQIISHGYTRIRFGDIITVVGATESIDKFSLKFQGIRDIDL